MPAGMEHEIRMSGRVAMRTLYIDPKAAPTSLGDCTVIEVTPLFAPSSSARWRSPSITTSAAAPAW